MQNWFAIAALAAIYTGMSGLCLAMERHFSQVFGKEPRANQQRGLRAIGWLLLALALYCSVRAWGGVVGPFVWIAALTAMTGTLVMLMTYRGRLALPSAGCSLALLLVSGVTALVK